MAGEEEKMADGPPPNQTLYIRGINEKYSKAHRLHDLKSTLTNLCKPGDVIDIVALSNFYDKGQAFVVMKNVEQATAALKKLQGYELEGKNITVAYAKTKSHAAEKLEGTYAGHKRRQRPPPPTGKKAKMVMDDDDDEPKSAPLPPTGFGMGPPGGFAPPPGMQQPAAYGGAPPSQQMQPSSNAPPQQQGPPLPHPILFLENIPHEAKSDDVAELFRQFMGFKEVRMIPSRPGLAFVEFENEMQSNVAMQRLQGVQLMGQAITISFSRS